MGNTAILDALTLLVVDPHEPREINNPALGTTHLGVASLQDTMDAVTEGNLIAVDVGLIDGRPFLNTASFGSYAALVDARELFEKRIGKWPAMALGLIRVLRTEKPIRLEINGETIKLWMIFIGNCVYEPPGLVPAWRRTLHDGLLDVRYVESASRRSRVRLVLAVVTGQLARSRMYHRVVVDSLIVCSPDGPLRLACDGETFDASSERILIGKHPTPLAIYAPRHDTEC